MTEDKNMLILMCMGGQFYSQNVNDAWICVCVEEVHCCMEYPILRVEAMHIDEIDRKEYCAKKSPY